MNTSSSLAVSNFTDFGIVSNLLSPTIEFSLSEESSSISRLGGVTLPLDSRALMADTQYWCFFYEISDWMGVRCGEVFDAKSPWAFTMDADRIRRDASRCSGRGIVILLPKSFSAQAKTLCQQKPTLVNILSADYQHSGRYFCWKVDQKIDASVYDLWLQRMRADTIYKYARHTGENQDSEDGGEMEYVWTDVVTVCDDNVHFGGFWSCEDDVLDMQAADCGPSNYKPGRVWSDAELAEAGERAAAIGDIAPWEHQVCSGEDGRRFLAVDVSHVD